MNNHANDAGASVCDAPTAASLVRSGLSGVTLRPYQLAGVAWLASIGASGHGGILADEMGLGKTVQTIGLLAHIVHAARNASAGPARPSLVVVPLSLLANWDAEMARYAPALRRRSYVGDPDRRAQLQEEIRSLVAASDLDVLITTYEMCTKDAEFMGDFRWACLVVDEGHRLKNAEALLYGVLSSLRVTCRFLLTGTPVQNNLGELYALLSFVAPSFFPAADARAFLAKHADIEHNRSGADTLHSLLEPFLLRRVKSDVAADLPPKEELVLYTSLTAVQRRVYRAVLTKDVEALAAGSKARLANMLVQLRKCVNHPYLFEGVEPEPFVEGEHLVEASGKLRLLDRLLSRLRAQGHKVLVFSQMARVLDILQDYATFRRIPYERLDGSVRGDERDAAVRSFQTSPPPGSAPAADAPWLFLLSTRAGGLGLNLTSADTVIFYDSDFNPQSDLQAAARAHRIGQDRPVKIIRLVARDSVDEVVLARAEKKLRLTRAVIARGRFAGADADDSGGGADMDTDELRVILRHGIERILSDTEGEKEGEDAHRDDAIDRLIGRSEDGRWVVDPARGGASGNNAIIDNAHDDADARAAEERERADAAAADALLAQERVRRGIDPNQANQPARGRRELSADELELRRQGARKRALEREEAEVRREEAKLRKRQKLWADSGYVSASVEDDDSSSGVDDDADGDAALLAAADAEDRAPLAHCVGDVTRACGTPDRPAIIGIPVDDTGSWGRGGLFRALSAVSQRPREHYELAGRMGDLALGDAHIADMDISGARVTLACLLVVQTRDARGRIQPIDAAAIDSAMHRLGSVARRLGATVHVPRIGHGDPAFSYYRCERLMRKHLSARGIPASVYFYRAGAAAGGARQSVDASALRPECISPAAATHVEPPSDCNDQRMGSSDDDDGDTGDDDSGGASGASGASGAIASSAQTTPHAPLAPISVCFYRVAAAEAQALARYVVAYGGKASGRIAQHTTHVVCGGDVASWDGAVHKFRADHAGILLVGVAWLRKCVARAELVDSSPYTL